MATFYSDLAVNQQDGLNFPGGGLTTQPSSYNDIVPDLGSVNRITAIYTIVGTEVATDTIRLARIPAGSYVSVSSTVSSNGVAATTFNIKVGDTDTNGGLVSADTGRYCNTLNVAAAVTSPTIFVSGTTLFAPTLTTDEGCWLTVTIGTITGALTVGGKLVFRINMISAR